MQMGRNNRRHQDMWGPPSW